MQPSRGPPLSNEAVAHAPQPQQPRTHTNDDDDRLSLPFSLASLLRPLRGSASDVRGMAHSEEEPSLDGLSLGAATGLQGTRQQRFDDHDHAVVSSGHHFDDGGEGGGTQAPAGASGRPATQQQQGAGQAVMGAIGGGGGFHAARFDMGGELGAPAGADGASAVDSAAAAAAAAAPGHGSLLPGWNLVGDVLQPGDQFWGNYPLHHQFQHDPLDAVLAQAQPQQQPQSWSLGTGRAMPAGPVAAHGGSLLSQLQLAASYLPSQQQQQDWSFPVPAGATVGVPVGRIRGAASGGAAQRPQRRPKANANDSQVFQTLLDLATPGLLAAGQGPASGAAGQAPPDLLTVWPGQDINEHFRQQPDSEGYTFYSIARPLDNKLNAGEPVG